MKEGRVGNKKVLWEVTPKGKRGQGVVSIDGVKQTVSWVRDDQGIWIETAKGFVGYELRKTTHDDGLVQYVLLKRMQAGVVSGLAFLKAGEEAQSSQTSKGKKGKKIKSQMPGKILRIQVKAGEVVSKGQALLVMEAMKMENEIKALQDGVIQEIKVSEGQAVETGAELLSLV